MVGLSPNQQRILDAIVKLTEGKQNLWIETVLVKREIYGDKPCPEKNFGLGRGMYCLERDGYIRTWQTQRKRLVCLITNRR